MLENKLNIVGIGLEGQLSLNAAVKAIVEQATILAGSDRHLSYFPQHPAQRLVLNDLAASMVQLRGLWERGERIVVLVTGDPLFFGLGRLLLQEFPADAIAFHPHLSCLQLAFNRLKVPWQDVCIVSAHGRSTEALTEALQQGRDKIAILTDSTNTPDAIAQLYLDLDLPLAYDFWTCENLGGTDERVRCFSPELLRGERFAPLNLLVLLRRPEVRSLDLSQLPLFGLPDSLFYSFPDRPGLMTKREVRLTILGELALQPGQIVWDIGAGTGSVSVEIARLCPDSQVYAIEKTAIGCTLIEQNRDRFAVPNLFPVRGQAPDILASLPAPDRVFIGGSSGNLRAILEVCRVQLAPDGVLVAAFATVEHLSTCLEVLRASAWQFRLLQLNFARSHSVAQLTRFSPLNPVTLAIAHRNQHI
ncbi:precorrin-6y C5,15-methyltransferase (decarboxylating) subunit CbiE [Oscillatoria sp. FACHB-1406]|nr:precorrin-6y C5,15-methyltransferase (decarboxylating) subunit CbiE [Oscillatoria sp. FACHB-1406]